MHTYASIQTCDLLIRGRPALAQMMLLWDASEDRVVALDDLHEQQTCAAAVKGQPHICKMTACMAVSCLLPGRTPFFITSITQVHMFGMRLLGVQLSSAS